MVLDHLVDRAVDVALLLRELLVGRLRGRRERADAVDGAVQRLAHERRGQRRREPVIRGASRLADELPMPMRPPVLVSVSPRAYRARVNVHLCPAWMEPCRSSRPRPAWVFPDVALLPDDRATTWSAMGADLEPGTLLAAYRRGLFPMPLGRRRAPMLLVSPVAAGVLPLDGLRVSRSLRQSVRRIRDPRRHRVRRGDRRLRRPRRAGGWIDDEIRRRRTSGCTSWAGRTRSRPGATDGWSGGLYGVAVGGLFAGESMFHRETDASKVALVGLVELLSDEHADRRLLDVQWQTPHLASLGVVERGPAGLPADDRRRGRGPATRTASADPGRSSRRAGHARTTVEPGRQTTCGVPPVSLTIGRPAPSQSSIPPSRFTTS